MSADIALINDARHINRWKIEIYHIAGIDQYQVAVRTTDDTSEARVDISSIGIQRWDLITKIFASTIISHNEGKKPVLTSKLDPFMDEYRSGILATDDITEVRVYISSMWIYRRGLCTATSYNTYISHNHKLQMRTDEASDDLFETE